MRIFSGNRMGYAFVAPVLILLILLNVYPLAYNVVLGFRDASLTGIDSGWTGGANYARIFRDGRFATAMRTTGLFVGAAVGLELLIGFAAALALQKPFPGRGALVVALLIPMMLSQAVMGLYWNLVLNGHYGIVNLLLSGAGLSNPPQWLTDPNLKLASIILIDVWMWTPFMMLIAMAGLNAIPKHLYEAAAIDRASPWLVFRRITLPLCAPLLVLAVLLRTTDALKQFDLVMAVTGPNDNATQTVSALLYQVIFRGGKVGLGSAYAIVVLVVVIALASLFTRYIDRLQRSQGRAAP